VNAVDHKSALAKPVVKAETTEQRKYCEELMRAI